MSGPRSRSGSAADTARSVAGPWHPWSPTTDLERDVPGCDQLIGPPGPAYVSGRASYGTGTATAPYLVVRYGAVVALRLDHAMILVTRPAPTVRPPSRMANFSPASMAIGFLRWTVMSVLSPGMTMSLPSGRTTSPVTSVVRK